MGCKGGGESEIWQVGEPQDPVQHGKNIKH